MGGSVQRTDNSYVSLAIPVRTLLEYGAYLSGSPSKPYTDAPLPTFPPLLDSSVAEPVEDPDNGENEEPVEGEPELMILQKRIRRITILYRNQIQGQKGENRRFAGDGRTHTARETRHCT